VRRSPARLLGLAVAADQKTGRIGELFGDRDQSSSMIVSNIPVTKDILESNTYLLEILMKISLILRTESHVSIPGNSSKKV